MCPNVERADGYFREALTVADELGMRPLVAHCQAHLGTLFRKAGRHQRARQHLAEAMAMYREMDMRARMVPPGAELGEMG